MKDKILLLALENAVKYEGKAAVGSVIGKLISQEPGLKEDKEKMAKVSKEIAVIVREVNAMSFKDQQQKFHALGGEIITEKKERTSVLPRLKTTGKPVVLRFEPSPSGPLHIGHAYVISLNYEYAREYQGKLILRISDTNASNINPASYALIPEDAKWLTNNGVSEVIIQSDRINLYYDYALKFINAGHCYICTCSSESFKEYVQKQEDCPCRSLSVEQNVKRWHDMFTKYNEGDAVMRFKTDMRHKNPAMRDFPLFRVNDDEHARTGKKYRVWPLMNFAVLSDDHDMGVTHILRAKDHADNAKRQEMMYKSMGWDVPETLFVGRINFEDLEVSCSKTRAKIEAGEFTGWDDIRLPFLLALRKRGYQPEAFIRHALDVGVSLNDKTVSKKDFFKAINFFNKEILEARSDRYFFVADPVAVKVDGAPDLEVVLDLHPTLRKGGRLFHCDDEYYLAKEDVLSFKQGDIIRLMDCINLEVTDIKNVNAAVKSKMHATYHSTDFEQVKGKARLIHWLPKDEAIKVDVVMDDGSIVNGFGEKLLNDLKEGDIVQFMRFGFCRLDKIEDDKLIFWFAHK